MSQQIFSVFVGDLSIFCNESHIKLAFAKFGEIMAVRIAFDEESHKQLPYGFVDFATTESANEAMTSMDGTILCGRRIRVKWATNRRKEIVEVKPPSWNDDYGTASVHVIYLSYKCETRITEEFLRALFSKYGDVQDVMIKKSSFNQENSMQKGYGFVHFADNEEGIKASLSAVEDLFDSTIDNVNYTCSISRTFERKLISSGGSPVVHTISRDENQQHIDEKDRAAFALPTSGNRPTSWPRNASPQLSGSSGSNSGHGEQRSHHIVSPPRPSGGRVSGFEHRQQQQQQQQQQQILPASRMNQDSRFTYASCPTNGYLPPRGIAMQMQAQHAYYGQQQQQQQRAPSPGMYYGDASGAPVYYPVQQQGYMYPVDPSIYQQQYRQQQQQQQHQMPPQQSTSSRMQQLQSQQQQQLSYSTPPHVYSQQTHAGMQAYPMEENGSFYYSPHSQQQQQQQQQQSSAAPYVHYVSPNTSMYDLRTQQQQQQQQPTQQGQGQPQGQSQVQQVHGSTQGQQY